MNFLKSLFLVVLTFLSTATKLWSQTNEQVWTLEKCIEYAKGHNIELRKTQLQYESARLDLNIAYGNLLPTINFRYSNAFNYGRSIDPLTNSYTNQEINTNTYSITSTLPLFASFKNLHTIKREKLNVTFQQLQQEKAGLNVIKKIFDNYLNVLLNQELLKTAELNARRTQDDIERTIKLIENRSLARKSLLEFENQKIKDELAIAEYQLKISEAKLILCNTMGLDSDYEIVLDQPSFTFADSSSSILDISKENVLKAAERNYNVKQEEVRQQILLQEKGIARSNMLPKLDLSGTLYSGYSNGVRKFNPSTGTFEKYDYWQQIDENQNKTFSFNLSIPILNGGYYRFNYQKADIAYQNSFLQLDERTRAVKEELIGLYNGTYLEFKRFNAAEKEVVISKELYEISRREYEQRIIATHEYIWMKNNYTLSERNRIQRQYSYLFSYKILEMYLGVYFE
ncbi:MAG: transporter [Chitinophagaceae bacterium]|nr:transporter [Chitinophagaceae bacterium]